MPWGGRGLGAHGYRRPRTGSGRTRRCRQSGRLARRRPSPPAFCRRRPDHPYCPPPTSSPRRTRFLSGHDFRPLAGSRIPCRGPWPCSPDRKRRACHQRRPPPTSSPRRTRCPGGHCCRRLPGSRSPWRGPGPCSPSRRRKSCRHRCRPPTTSSRRTTCPPGHGCRRPAGYRSPGGGPGPAPGEIGVDLVINPVHNPHRLAVGPDAHRVIVARGYQTIEILAAVPRIARQVVGVDLAAFVRHPHRLPVGPDAPGGIVYQTEFRRRVPVEGGNDPRRHDDQGQHQSANSQKPQYCRDSCISFGHGHVLPAVRLSRTPVAPLDRISRVPNFNIL